MPKVTNKDYEEVDQVELPGGENVRLGYSRSMSLDYGKRKVDFHYSADFPTDEVDEALERIQNYIDGKVRVAITKEV